MCVTLGKNTKVMGEHSKVYLLGVFQLHLI